MEAELLKIYKNKQQPELAPYFYTVTDIRENILNWYPFKKTGTILEVGAGLGAVTGCLCQKAKKVVSVEYSKRRAEVLCHRHHDKKNLEVIVGNLQKIKFKEKFDYIVLVGVFEYAKRFYQTKNPFHDFLKDMKKLLSLNGVILIAIENRYGIKYFAGATEDHYDIKYKGLYGYHDTDVQTFGKIELEEIIKEAGFLDYKFYYPNPDYKMTDVVYTDQRPPFKTELGMFSIYNHGEQEYEYDYRQVLGGIIDNKQYGFFANSFLVEIANHKENLSPVVFARTSLYRSRPYQIQTIIKDSHKIIKVPKYPEAKQHLDNMVKTHAKLKKLGLRLSSFTKKSETEYQVEYIPGETVYEYLQKLVEKKDKDGVLKELDNYYNYLKSFSRFSKIKKFANKKEQNFFKDKKAYILKENLFDAHLANLIKNKDGYYLIDQEWISDFCVPVNFAMYVSLMYFFQWVIGAKNLFSEKELYGRYKITPKEKQVYDNMSKTFSQTLQNIDIPTTKLVGLNNQMVLSDAKNQQLKENILQLTQQLEAQKQESSQQLEAQKQEFEASTSWRITKPLRLAKLTLDTLKKEGVVVTSKKVVKKIAKKTKNKGNKKK